MLTYSPKSLPMKNSFAFALLIGLLFSCAMSDDEGLTGYSALSLDGNTEFTATSGDQYTELDENPFIDVTDQPVSTFSIDADGASYANVRRFLQQDQALPPKGAIRTEELINYFDLDYDFVASNDPISLNGEVSYCPWNKAN